MCLSLLWRLIKSQREEATRTIRIEIEKKKMRTIVQSNFGEPGTGNREPRYISNFQYI